MHDERVYLAVKCVFCFAQHCYVTMIVLTLRTDDDDSVLTETDDITAPAVVANPEPEEANTSVAEAPTKTRKPKRVVKRAKTKKKKKSRESRE